MKRIKFWLSLFALTWLGTALAINGSEERTVLEGLQNSPEQFSTFLELLDGAGLSASLQGADPVTVLAPTNEAFEQLDAAVFDSLRADPMTMAGVLEGHILPGAYTLNDLQDADPNSLVAMSGEALDVAVTAGGLKVNGIGFAPTDVDNVFSNGVVHVTNEVVLPALLRTDEDATMEETNPADAAAPAAPAVVPPAAPGTTDAAAQQPTTAFVRVAQLSPNATIDLLMTPQEASAQAVEVGGLAYGQATDYQAIEPGEYQVTATLAGADTTLFDAYTTRFDAGRYYTVGVHGLQLPADEAPADEAEGFVGWVRGLFGNEQEDRDALALRASTYLDEVRAADAGRQVRIIDAAPGSPAFDVVVLNAQGESSVLVGDMTYGDDSGVKALPEDATGLQITAAGSSVVVLDAVSATPLPSDATVFLIGTTFEGAPYQALVLENGGAVSAAAN